MTFEEYLRAVGREQTLHPEWRWGQTLFNVLCEYRPEIAEKLRGGPIDPFHRNEVSDDFLNEVERLIEVDPPPDAAPNARSGF